ncbi:MAG: hypothetical protein ACKPKO_41125, partial [Candidatus Fonsibacter sp.]
MAIIEHTGLLQAVRQPPSKDDLLRLQGLLNKGALQPEQVILGGRLPDHLQQSGVLDYDKEHFRKLVLGQAKAQSQLHTYMTYHVRLE